MFDFCSSLTAEVSFWLQMTTEYSLDLMWVDMLCLFTNKNKVK